MPPYSWLHMESVWWLLLGGLLFAAAIVLARSSASHSFSFRSRSDEDIKKEVHRFADEVEERNGPAPVFIWMVGLGMLIWAVAYTVHSGVHGL